MTILIGAIADDFTGATDLASILVKQGMRVIQVIGVPDKNTDANDAQAIIIALKSRTIAVGEAVDQSIAALKWLKRNGAMQIFFKYCSTFDSTSEGNIGPVSDALLEALGSDFAFVCPAFPANGRSVCKGELFVGDQLLADSPMKDHPLTPMRDSNLVRLMSAQSGRPVALIDIDTVRLGTAAIKQRVDRLKAENVGYGVIDAMEDDDLRIIGAAAADHALVTGGSAVAMGLPDNFREQGMLNTRETTRLPVAEGRCAVLAGSCSEATRNQIAHVVNRWPCRKIDVDAIEIMDDIAARLVAWAAEQSGNSPVLIYASSNPDEVARIQHRFGVDAAGAMIENLMGLIAVGLFDIGYRRLVVAGGETAGAVVSALQVKSLRIGPEIDPGVPWTVSLGERQVALALKSGNFGSEDFFIKAFEALK